MWELIWLMVIMKIPIVYLCWVVYWAIKSEPSRPEPATLPTRLEDDPRSWLPRRGGPRRGPHGRPARTYARTRRAKVRA